MIRAIRKLPAQETGLILVILMLGALLAGFSKPVVYYDAQTKKHLRVNRFLQPGNLDNLMKNTSFFAIMAVGATFVIISGGIDLSVGAVYCLSAICGAFFLRYCGPTGAGAGMSNGLIVAGAILICLGVGAACGLANGSMIVYLRVHPFIITLGTMAVFRGIAFVNTKGQSIGSFSPAFTDDLIRQTFGTRFYPIPMTVMLVVTLAAGLMLHRMGIGRKVYAIGGNEEAGRFSGLRVNRVKLFVYLSGGLTAGIASLIFLGYYGSATSQVGEGYELEVIAAAVVGGASLSGGKGTALGAMLGALVIRLIDNGVIILGIDQNYNKIIMGCVIILAVLLDQVSGWVRRKTFTKLRVEN